MADDAETREDDLRQLLTDAVEVQLAALSAGVAFWTDWITQTSEFVQSATKTLASITSADHQTKDSILELVDAGRASLRAMTEIPRNTATRFIEELDKLHAEVAPAPAAKSAKATPGSASSPKKAPSSRPRPKRAGRAKA
jgi:hypothetical protein